MNQKHFKKDFAIKDYYRQLEKYQTSSHEMKNKIQPKEFKKEAFSLADSLSNSVLDHPKWQEDKILKPSKNQKQEQKENLTFNEKYQKQFVDHCTKLYGIKHSNNLVEDISNQINKRDEVYDLISTKFTDSSEEKYPEKLQEYFKEHDLMKKIIREFKSISKLHTQDLNELYYFLKTDR